MNSILRNHQVKTLFHTARNTLWMTSHDWTLNQVCRNLQRIKLLRCLVLDNWTWYTCFGGDVIKLWSSSFFGNRFKSQKSSPTSLQPEYFTDQQHGVTLWEFQFCPLFLLTFILMECFMTVLIFSFRFPVYCFHLSGTASFFCLLSSSLNTSSLVISSKMFEFLKCSLIQFSVIQDKCFWSEMFVEVS